MRVFSKQFLNLFKTAIILLKFTPISAQILSTFCPSLHAENSPFKVDVQKNDHENLMNFSEQFWVDLQQKGLSHRIAEEVSAKRCPKPDVVCLNLKNAYNLPLAVRKK